MGWDVDGDQAKKDLEGAVWGAVPVESEGDLVNIALQVLLANAMDGCFATRSGGFRRPDRHEGGSSPPALRYFGFCSVTVAHVLQRGVTSPPIGQDDCPALDILLDEARERGCGGFEFHVESYPTRTLSPPPRRYPSPAYCKGDVVLL